MIATIGVYGFDRNTFLETLRQAEVNLVLDVRHRRGVRGAEYASANARRLQAALAEAGIGYEHLPELAPTTELREAQYREDARRGEGKRSRTVLAPEYVSGYTGRVSTRPTSRRSSGSSAIAELRCSASSATPKRATGP